MLDQLTQERLKLFVRFLTKTRNKRMERTVNVVLVCIIVLLFVFRPWGAVSTISESKSVSTANEEYVFLGVSVGNPYWVDARLGLEDKAKMLGVKCDLRGPNGNDPNQQVKEFEQLLARKPAGILIAPASSVMTPSIDRAIDQGIPVICIDTDDPNSKRYAYIGTDNYNAGRQTGLMLARAIRGKRRGRTSHIPGQLNHEERARGCKDVPATYPDIKLVKIGNDQALATEAEKVARDHYSRHTRISLASGVWMPPAEKVALSR